MQGGQDHTTGRTFSTTELGFEGDVAFFTVQDKKPNFIKLKYN